MKRSSAVAASARALVMMRVGIARQWCRGWGMDGIRWVGSSVLCSVAIR